MANELMTIGEGNWLALKGAVGGMPLPFGGRVMLWEGALIVDPNHRRVDFQQLVKGQKLKAVRKPKLIPEDPKAVAVTIEGVTAGWLPLRCGPIVARMMDAGKKIGVEFKSYEVFDEKWEDARVQVYLEEM